MLIKLPIFLYIITFAGDRLLKNETINKYTLQTFLSPILIKKTEIYIRFSEIHKDLPSSKQLHQFQFQEIGVCKCTHFLIFSSYEFLHVPLFFQQTEDGLIDIREYVTALSVVCRPSKTLQTMKLAFKASNIFHLKCLMAI